MSCAGNLTKSIKATYIPGDPGMPATPGSPYVPAYCATTSYNQCGWIPNPAVTYKWVPVTSTLSDGSTVTYYVWSPLYNGLPLYGGVQLQIWACTTQYSTVCYPEVAAIPGTPGLPATPSQLLYTMNVGWNTHSRTIGKLENEGFLRFTVDPANTGLFMGVDTVGKDAQNLYSFKHGMLFDLSGVWVFENGAQVAQLMLVFDGTVEMRIERRIDGSITYVAGSTSYTSAAKVSPAAELYIYGQMYTSNDRVLCASWDVLSATYSTGTLTGEGTLLMAAPMLDGVAFETLTFSGSGSLVGGGVVKNSAGVVVQPHPESWMGLGLGSLLVTPTSTDGYALFPGLTVFGSESADYMLGYSFLPAMSNDGNMIELYVPPKPTSGYGNLPLMASVGIVLSVDMCEGDASFPMLQAIGGDYEYGIASAYLPGLVSWSDEGQQFQMSMISHGYIYDTHDQLTELVLVIMSDGTLQSVYQDSIIKVQSYISELIATSNFTLLGEYGLELLSQLRAMSINVQTFDGQAALDSVGRVWVVNMDSAASTQYENYGFNSFFVRNGESYGVADDGVYRLSGDTDLLKPITAQINLGSNRLGSPKDKRLPAVYVNAASDGKLILKVEVDGGTAYYYEARSSSETLDNHRVDTGRGLIGNNWTFTLMNQDGDDFELANLEFVPMQGGRRI